MVKKLKLKKSDRDKVLVLPDIHFPEHDEKALGIVLQVMKMDEFDTIIILGDMLDMYSLSRFTKKPELLEGGIIRELTLGREFLEKIRQLQPRADIIFILGNHERRLEKYICDHAPALSGLIEYSSALGLKELDIKLVDGMHKMGHVNFFHGVKVCSESAASARAHFATYNMSMVIGHTHRLGSYFKTNLSTTYSVHEAGCLCSLEPHYLDGKPFANWQQGFVVVYIDKKTKWYFPVEFPIVNHTCVYDGYLIRG